MLEVTATKRLKRMIKTSKKINVIFDKEKWVYWLIERLTQQNTRWPFNIKYYSE